MAQVLEELSNEELTRVLNTRTEGVAALGKGLSLAARTAAVGAPVAVAYGVATAWVGTISMKVATGLLTADRPTVDLVMQIGFGTGLLCGVYALLNFQKRDTASRASWLPALLTAPALLVAASGLALQSGGPGRQMGPVVLQLVMGAADLVFGAVAGAVACVVWLVAGRAAIDGRSAPLSEIVERVQRQWLDVVPIHGGRDQAVTIGMQLLLPGIFYALQLAFAEMIVVLDPEKPAMRRSSQLTTGMRGRIFRAVFGWFVAWSVVMIAIVAVDTKAASVDAMVAAVSKVAFDPSVVQGPALYTSEVAAALLWWVFQLAMLWLYVERENQVRAKTLLRQRAG